MQLEEREFTCPVCATLFSAEVCDTPPVVTAKRTDFYERHACVSPLPYYLVTCTHCAFTRRLADWPEPVEFLTQVYVGSLQRPNVTSERYEAAARIGEHEQLEGSVVARLWLSAAWCAADEQDSEAERYYQLRAVRAFEVLMAGFNDVEADRRGSTTYLIGELWRRVGDLAKAAAWCGRVPSETTEQWLLAAATQQLTSPREWFG